jgi:hypothetical protein
VPPSSAGHAGKPQSQRPLARRVQSVAPTLLLEDAENAEDAEREGLDEGDRVILAQVLLHPRCAAGRPVATVRTPV